MNAKELREYLGIVVDMEKECYIQETLKNQLIWKINSLEKTKTKGIEEPVHENKSDKLDILIGGFLIGAIVFFLISWGFGDSMKIVALLGGVLGFFLFMWVVIRREKKFENKYKEELQEYEKAVAADKLRVLNEQKEVNFLRLQLKELNRQLMESTETLKAIYDKNIIFPKYRNWVMVSSLYEYLCAGRCQTLEGHEGAYNILENEMRLDRIILQMDYIISQLEQIKENQYMIYSAIAESNQVLTKILNSNQEISEKLQHIDLQGEKLNERIALLQSTSEFQFYYTQLSQKNQAYKAQLGL